MPFKTKAQVLLWGAVIITIVKGLGLIVGLGLGTRIGDWNLGLRMGMEIGNENGQIGTEIESTPSPRR